jgi:hypothetical protein
MIPLRRKRVLPPFKKFGYTTLEEYNQHTMSGLSSETVLADLAKFRADKLADDLKYIRSRNPKTSCMTDEELANIFKDSVTCFQKKAGKFVERRVEAALTALGLPYMPQVRLDKNGIIVGFGKKQRGCTIPDIVFGNPTVGTHISQYIVMSLKISTRERDKLDSYFRKHAPKLFLYASLDDDYPHPDVFDECLIRKLVCATPKKKDDRVFKLGFEDIEATVLAAL